MAQADCTGQSFSSRRNPPAASATRPILRRHLKAASHLPGHVGAHEYPAMSFKPLRELLHPWDGGIRPGLVFVRPLAWGAASANPAARTRMTGSIRRAGQGFASTHPCTPQNVKLTDLLGPDTYTIQFTRGEFLHGDGIDAWETLNSHGHCVIFFSHNLTFRKTFNAFQVWV